jgi:hypothetical protein
MMRSPTCYRPASVASCQVTTWAWFRGVLIKEADVLQFCRVTMMMMASSAVAGGCVDLSYLYQLFSN